MRGKLIIEQPDEIEATISLTLPLSAWKKLRGELAGGSWPASELTSCISDLVRQVEREFYGSEEADTSVSVSISPPHSN